MAKNKFNRQAIVIKNLLDKKREDHEAAKFIFYSSDNSEGSKRLMANTDKIGFFRARYLNPDSLTFRNSLFKDDNK